MSGQFARTGAAVVFVTTAVFSGVGCSSGPTTKEALCEGYDDLSAQLLEGNGLFGNPLFRSAGNLGDLASNYEESGAVQSDGDALGAIADSEETDGGELSDATGAIAQECGKPPLSVNAIIGGS